MAPLILDQLPDAVGVGGFVRQHDGARAEATEPRIGDLPVVRLTGGQAEPDRKALRVDNNVDLSREPTSASNETVICTPLFPVAACGRARTEVLSSI